MSNSFKSEVDNDTLPQPIFLFGYSVRSGTNYLGSIMSYCKSISSIPPSVSHGEFALIRKDIDEAFEKYVSTLFDKSFGLRKVEVNEYKELWGKAILNHFKIKYKVNTPYVFFKDPNVLNLDKIWNYFPEAKVLLLVRDGRNVVSSYAKGATFVKNSYSTGKKLKMKFKTLLGLHFISACRTFNVKVRHLVSTITKLEELNLLERIVFVEYEHIVNNPQGIASMFQRLDVPISDKEIGLMVEADVVGSSFYETLSKESSAWVRVKNPENFAPTSRWIQWSGFQKFVFRLLSQKNHDLMDKIIREKFSKV